MKRSFDKQNGDNKRIRTDENNATESLTYTSPQSPREDPRWDRKQWNTFVELCLEFFASGSSSSNDFLNEYRLLFPQNRNGIFCYFFKGKFLPSGNQDGLYWRPSQGISLKGSKIRRRYFYARLGDGTVLKRQVSWISDFPNICVVEYRRDCDAEVRFSDLSGPFDWMDLIKNVLQFHTNVTPPSPPTEPLRIAHHFPSLEQDEPETDSDLSTPTSSPYEVLSSDEDPFNRPTLEPLRFLPERSIWYEFENPSSLELF